MSLCSRGAISKALRFSVLRIDSKRFSHRLSQTISPIRNAVPVNISGGAWRQYHQRRYRSFSTATPRLDHASAEHLTNALPLCCPGCGAFSQTIEPSEPGYYSTSRKQIRKLLAAHKDSKETEADDTGTITANGFVSEDSFIEATERAVAPSPVIHGKSPSCSLPVPACLTGK